MKIKSIATIAAIALPIAGFAQTPPAPPQPWTDLPKVLELAKRAEEHVTRHRGGLDEEVLPDERGQVERRHEHDEPPPALQLDQRDDADDHQQVAVDGEPRWVGREQDPVPDDACEEAAGRDLAAGAPGPATAPPEPELHDQLVKALKNEQTKISMKVSLLSRYKCP